MVQLMVPVLLMMFFVVRYIFFPVEQTAVPVSVLLCTPSCSAATWHQSFGREGEVNGFK